MKRNLFDCLCKERKAYWLLAFVVLLFLAYQVDNTPRDDDEYLGEQVFWLLKTGKVKSELGYCTLGYDVYQSLYHKLFIYSGYLFCRLGGWSLLSLHTVTYACFLGFLSIFYYYTRIHYGAKQKAYFFAVITLLLFNQDLLYAAGSFRPEIMVMALGFLSYTLLTQYLRKHTLRFLFGAGITAGLCAFAHLNGTIFIVAGGMLLLSKKEYRAALIFGLTAALAFAPYFADVFYYADLAYFWRQFRQDPVLASSCHWYTPLLQVIKEQQRFLFSPKEIVFTTLLLMTLLFSYSHLKAKHSSLLHYTLILVLTLALICPSKSTKYLVLYLPFLYLTLVEGWRYLEAKRQRGKLIAVRTMLVATVLLSICYSARQIGNNIINLRTGGIVAEHRKLAASIKEAHNQIDLLGPRLMIFNELGKFNSIQDIELIATADFIPRIQHSGIRYIIFSERDRRYFNVPQLLRGTDIELLPIDSTEHYLLVKVKK